MLYALGTPQTGVLVIANILIVLATMAIFNGITGASSKYYRIISNN